jgi:cyclopropane-fatty-acyl-phospholipid synthase
MENAMSEALTREEARGDTSRPGLREWLLTRWLKRIRVGRLTIEFPSGTRKTFEGSEAGPHASLKVNDLQSVLRILVSGEIGLAEGYMENEWDTPDLRSLLTLGVLNGDAFSDALGQSWIMKAINGLRHDLRANTRSGSRRNIAAHYDLGNEFYGLWLDETMTYSSALFMALDEPLLEAQRRKYLRLAEKLDLRPGERILEIGCGWGGFAEIAAAEFGCEVVGLTLSVEQAAYCHDRMARAGLVDKVDIRVQDYRDVTGQFDKIVSVEMFEAVGEEYWSTYLDVLRNRLKPEGRAALQIITIDDRRFETYRRGTDFVQRYIFPGGMLPGPRAFSHAVSASGFEISDAHYFGKSYAETLRRWDRMFQTNRAQVEKQGFDQRFCRMWHYYLRYCEVGFDCEQIDVGQFVIERI